MSAELLITKIFALGIITYSVYNIFTIMGHLRTDKYDFSNRNKTESIVLILSNLLMVFLGVFLILPIPPVYLRTILGLGLVLINTILLKLHKL